MNHLDGVAVVSRISGEDIQLAKDKIPDFGSVSTSMGEAVETCYALGSITGINSTGRFSPQGQMNRAQTAVIYVRLKQVMENGTLTNGKPVIEGDSN